MVRHVFNTLKDKHRQHFVRKKKKKEIWYHLDESLIYSVIVSTPFKPSENVCFCVSAVWFDKKPGKSCLFAVSLLMHSLPTEHTSHVSYVV